MADLSALRKGLDARLATVDGLVGHSHTIPGSIPEPPFAYVSVPMSAGGRIMQFERSFQDLTQLVNLSVILLVSKVDDGIAQDTIDPFLGDDSTNTSSIYQAILKDPHLTFNNSATASSVSVRTAHSYGIHKLGGTDYLGCVFDVEIIPLRA